MEGRLASTLEAALSDLSLFSGNLRRATWKWPDDPLSSHRMHPFIVWRQKRPTLFTFFLLAQCILPEGPCSYDVCVPWGEGGVDEKQTKIVIGCVVVTVTEGSGIP